MIFKVLSILLQTPIGPLHKMAMWSFEANRPEILANFQAELGKVGATKGSWRADFDFVCQSFGVIPCPHVQQRPGDGAYTCIHISNCVLDLANWRACLLAYAVSGSKANEICIHNSVFSPQHMVDLAQAVAITGTLKSFKFEFSSLQNSHDEGSEAFHSLFSGSCCVEYISLRGCKLGTSALMHLLPSLNTNYYLQHLNLSGNDLTDDIIVELVRTLRLQPSVSRISLSRNLLSGEAIAHLAALLTGTDVQHEDQQVYKKVNAAIADKNKAIKATNKKKKKGGEEELSELPSAPERFYTVDGKSVVVNKSITFLDLSWNPLEREGVARAASLLTVAPQLTLLLRGVLHDTAECDEISAGLSEDSKARLVL